MLQDQPRRPWRNGPKATNAGCGQATLSDLHAAAFSDLGRRLSAVRTAREAAQIVAETADTLCGWDAFVLELFSPDQRVPVTVLCIDTIDGRRTETTDEAVFGQQGPHARKAVRDGPQLVLRGPGAKFPAKSLPFGDKARPSASLMYVPVRRDTEAIGVLSIQSYRLNAYTERDLRTLQALADHCVGALERIRATQENDRLERELRHRAAELERANSSLEERVRERTTQLESMNQELEAFCYSVSHDLRAPLRSIRGFSEVLLERHSQQLDARGLDYLQRACEACQHMDRLVEDLLQLSRVARAEMRHQQVNLSALASDLAAELSKTEPERKVEFVITPGLTVTGDERLLRLVLDNLLRNAWKFTKHRAQARIEFGVQPEPSPVFFVRDDGAGFDPAYSDRLFGVFQRLHAASEFPGTGVGLAIAKRIINRHGGRIWATGATGQGATFFFALPPE